MEFVKVLLLVCAAGLPRGDCQVDTALDVIAGPPARTPLACGAPSQAYFAGTVLGQRLTGHEYLKIVCGDGANAGALTAQGGATIAAEPSKHF